MGTGISTECRKCQNQETHLFGIGMIYSDLSNIISFFTPGVQKKVLELEGQHRFEEVDYSHDLFECIHCDTAHSRLSLEIKYSGSLVYKPQFKCYECKRKLKPTNRDVGSFKCRKCCSYDLVETNYINWD